MKLTLDNRILIFSFSILFVTILANSSLDIIGFKRDYENALVLRSKSLGASLRGSVEKVLGLGVDIGSLEGLTGKCRELVQGNPEISYCIISDVEGKPLYLSDSGFQSLQLNPKDEHYSANINRLVTLQMGDTSYYDTVTPIKSVDGTLAAYIHIGFNERLISDKIRSMVLRSLFILVLFFAVFFTVVLYFAKKNIMRPISLLLSSVKRISQGAFDTRIPEMRLYEFNELARSINFMSESLQVREHELRDNYRELESTHNRLRQSFQQLESLSLELENSEELYKSLLEDASDAIVVSGDDDSVKMVNKKAEELFGYSAREMTGLPITKLFLLLSVSNIPTVLKKYEDARKGSHVEEEIMFINRHGESRVAAIHANSVARNEERLVQSIFRDMTKEREIVRNLEKSTNDLARLNRMKDSFLGLASHELKTPLTVIMGYSELILTDMASNTDPAVLEMVSNISSAALRLDNIVKDMVDISLIDEKRLQLKLEEINPNRLIETSLNELRFFFSLRKQNVSVELDESVPNIMGDEIRLMQLLSNVLGNAIKFTPDGGDITVSSRVRYLLRNRQTSSDSAVTNFVSIGKEHHLYVEISIADSGIGIDQEDHVRIFDKFYEAGNIEEHSSGKVAFKARGTGLGLAIAKGIVEMHGGEIWVESRGCNAEHLPGSTFYILLPLNPLLGDATLDYLNILK
jgi:PAS domain S-box-containing protein